MRMRGVLKTVDETAKTNRLKRAVARQKTRQERTRTGEEQAVEVVAVAGDAGREA